MGPVQQAIQTAFRDRRTDLETLSYGAPFILTWDAKGIRVLPGRKQTPSRLTWACLEGVPDFLRGKDWIMAGGQKGVRGEPGTLDEYLKGCVKTLTSRWVVRVLRDAGVVEARIDPVEVRLTPMFERSGRPA